MGNRQWKSLLSPSLSQPLFLISCHLVENLCILIGLCSVCINFGPLKNHGPTGCVALILIREQWLRGGLVVWSLAVACEGDTLTQ